VNSGDYTVISPYLLPPGSPKKVNIGDGFILDSCIRLIGKSPKAVYTSRAPLSEEDLETINAGQFVLAAGANSLKDQFELTTGFSQDTLAKIRVPIVLFGIGHYGVDSITKGLDQNSRALFSAILERFPFVSVRCDASRRYLAASIPHHADRVLMTSCPVVFPVDGIDDGFIRKTVYDQLVVTITERAPIQSQMPILQAASAAFPARKRIYAVHQDYGDENLNSLARKLGYEIFRSSDYRDFIELYAGTDFHFGNRVHAHLKCLSMGKPSFLCPFDLRQAYFSESLDFPLITSLPNPDLERYDFARMVSKRSEAKLSLDRFLAAISALLT
jgi:Polysaccharide pyruvyl transferase